MCSESSTVLGIIVYKKCLIVHLMARCHSFNILLIWETVIELALVFYRWNCSTLCYIARAGAKLTPARVKGKPPMTMTSMVMSKKMGGHGFFKKLTGFLSDTVITFPTTDISVTFIFRT